MDDLLSCTGRIFDGIGPGFGIILLSPADDGDELVEVEEEVGGRDPEAGKVLWAMM